MIILAKSADLRGDKSLKKEEGRQLTRTPPAAMNVF